MLCDETLEFIGLGSAADASLWFDTVHVRRSTVAQALSPDIRERVIADIEKRATSGQSKRFEVKGSPTSAGRPDAEPRWESPPSRWTATGVRIGTTRMRIRSRGPESRNRGFSYPRAARRAVSLPTA